VCWKTGGEPEAPVLPGKLGAENAQENGEELESVLQFPEKGSGAGVADLLPKHQRETVCHIIEVKTF
jgi:hypothetical protein